ncbi:MAG: glutamate-1-semialdehyde 2,1-aminomutase [Acidobacteria bacterium]|nr:glutamate-1-semialdehyde 2,1-aminomutase [Acidobacteriota bacterium]
MKPRSHSRTIFQQAQEILVGGVNSPVRAFKAVGGDPLVVERAQGSRLYDVDGNEYIDFVCSWGAMILGHAHPAVTSAIQDQAARGTSYGMSTELELELARRIQKAMPAMEMVRFVSSGTEATMSAVRVARAFTRRNFIVKFDGGYHGHADGFLSQAGSGLATLGIASSPGVPECFAELTLNAPYNDIASVERLFDAHRGEIAAVIVEPVAANMGVVLPEESFLCNLRELTRKEGALLILDEVITGFRLALGGAQSVYGIHPDLTTLGKIIGGGLPAAAYGGRADVMSLVAPSGPVYQAGTLSGNPLAMRAGIETLKQLEAPGFYEQLNKKAERLISGFRMAVAESGLAAQVSAAGSLLTLFFAKVTPSDYEDAKRSDTQEFGAFFLEMLNRGVFLPPSQFEALFVSAAHSDSDIDRTIEACRESLKAVAGRK